MQIQILKNRVRPQGAASKSRDAIKSQGINKKTQGSLSKSATNATRTESRSTSTKPHKAGSKSRSTTAILHTANRLKKIALATVAILTVIFVTLTIVGCKFGLEEAFYRSNGVNERSAQLESESLPTAVTTAISNQGNKYNFLILTDIHYGANYDVPERKILSWLERFDSASTQAEQQKKPLFCVVLGDVVESGAREDYAHFETFQERLVSQGLPVYCIVGNHDLLNSGWDYWKTSCNPGNSFYRFQTGALSFYFTDTGSGTMGSKQLEALESAFESDTNRKLVFSHYPLYGGDAGIPLFSVGNAKERARIIDLYAENKVKYVFEGHCHWGGSHDFGSFKELVGKSLKSGKMYLVSVDETTTGDTNPVTKVTEIDLNSF